MKVLNSKWTWLVVGIAILISVFFLINPVKANSSNGGGRKNTSSVAVATELPKGTTEVDASGWKGVYLDGNMWSEAGYDVVTSNVVIFLRLDGDDNRVYEIPVKSDDQSKPNRHLKLDPFRMMEWKVSNKAPIGTKATIAWWRTPRK